MRLELQKITKQFPGVLANDRISISVDKGQVLGLLGENGAGKSTLMNILGCLDVPTGGVFRFRGVEVQKLDRDQRSLLRRRYLGFVFQGFNLLARTTAEAIQRAKDYRLI